MVILIETGIDLQLRILQNILLTLKYLLCVSLVNYPNSL